MRFMMSDARSLECATFVSSWDKRHTNPEYGVVSTPTSALPSAPSESGIGISGDPYLDGMNDCCATREAKWGDGVSMNMQGHEQSIRAPRNIYPSKKGPAAASKGAKVRCEMFRTTQNCYICLPQEPKAYAECFIWNGFGGEGLISQKCKNTFCSPSQHLFRGIWSMISILGYASSEESSFGLAWSPTAFQNHEFQREPWRPLVTRRSGTKRQTAIENQSRACGLHPLV